MAEEKKDSALEALNVGRVVAALQKKIENLETHIIDLKKQLSVHHQKKVGSK